MMCKISIITAIFNAERYLRRTIESVLAQTYKDWELLLVDDGSTDSSLFICEEYAEKDNRIHVYHKENGGVASARQWGIDNAHREYSIHCDSDDWMEPEMLECLYNRAMDTQADVVISDFYFDECGKLSVYKHMFCPEQSEEAIKEILYEHSFGSLWNKLIRHSLYRDFNVRFVPDINYCEDVLVLSQIFRNKVKVTYINKAVYHYCFDNKRSITRNYTRATLDMRKKYISALRDTLIGKEYQQAIDYSCLLVKLEGIKDGFLRWKDINRCGKDMKTTITAPFVKGLAIRMRVKYVIWHFLTLFF